jgi:hypothetical protein
MKLSEIVNVKPALEKIVASESSLPIKVAYRLSKLLKKVSNEYDYFNTARITLVKKYGNETVDGNFEVAEENRKTFFSDLSSLLEEDVSDFSFQPISLSDIPDSVQLTVVEASTLESFFVD